MATRTGGEPPWVWPAVVLALLLFAGALLVAALSLGAKLVSSFMLIFFRILLSLAVLGVALAFAIGPLALALGSFAGFTEKHPKVIKEIRHRFPALAAAGTLLAQATISIVDRAVGSSPVQALALQFLALGAFWIANEILLKKPSWRPAGIALWLATIAYLVWVATFTNGWSIHDLVAKVAALDSASLIGLVASVVLLVAIPFVLAPEAGAADAH